MPKDYLAFEVACHQFGRFYQQSATAKDDLVRRLKPVHSLPEAASASVVNLCSWSQDGSYLASTSDATVKIWDARRTTSHHVHSIDTGHTNTINGIRFFPDSSNMKLVTVSSDGQARVIDLEKMAIKSFCCHKSKIRAVAVAAPNIFLTGCEDGVIRQLDVREQPLLIDSSAVRDAYCGESVIVEQRSERTKERVGVNSIAVDPLKPMFATGGTDPLVRVYDARMMSRGRPMPWVLAYVPNQVAAASAGRSGPARQRHITSVAYDCTGHRLLASYSRDSIYSFSVKDDCFWPSTLPRELGGPSPRVPATALGDAGGGPLVAGNSAAVPRRPPRHSGIPPLPPLRAPSTHAAAHPRAGTGAGVQPPAANNANAATTNTASANADTGAGAAAPSQSDADADAAGGGGLMRRTFTPFGLAVYRRWMQLVLRRRQQQQQQQEQQQQERLQQGSQPQGQQQEQGQLQSLPQQQAQQEQQQQQQQGLQPRQRLREGDLARQRQHELQQPQPLQQGQRPQGGTVQLEKHQRQVGRMCQQYGQEAQRPDLERQHLHQQQRSQQVGGMGGGASMVQDPGQQAEDVEMKESGVKDGGAAPKAETGAAGLSGLPRAVALPKSDTDTAGPSGLPYAHKASRGRRRASPSPSSDLDATLPSKRPRPINPNPTSTSDLPSRPFPRPRQGRLLDSQRPVDTQRSSSILQQTLAPTVVPSLLWRGRTGQRVSAVACVRAGADAGADTGAPVRVQSVNTTWPDVHPTGPNSSRTGLHRVGSSSAWQVDLPTEGRHPHPGAAGLQGAAVASGGLSGVNTAGRDAGALPRGGRGGRTARSAAARGGNTPGGLTRIPSGGHAGAAAAAIVEAAATEPAEAASAALPAGVAPPVEPSGAAVSAAAAGRAGGALDTLEALGLLEREGGTAVAGTVARDEGAALDALEALEAIGALERQVGMQGAAGAGGVGAPAPTSDAVAALVPAHDAHADLLVDGAAGPPLPSRRRAPGIPGAPRRPAASDQPSPPGNAAAAGVPGVSGGPGRELRRTPSLTASQLGQLHGRDGAVIDPLGSCEGQQAVAAIEGAPQEPLGRAGLRRQSSVCSPLGAAEQLQPSMGDRPQCSRRHHERSSNADASNTTEQQAPAAFPRRTRLTAMQARPAQAQPQPSSSSLAVCRKGQETSQQASGGMQEACSSPISQPPGARGSRRRLHSRPLTSQPSVQHTPQQQQQQQQLQQQELFFSAQEGDASDPSTLDSPCTARRQRRDAAQAHSRGTPDPPPELDPALLLLGMLPPPPPDAPSHRTTDQAAGRRTHKPIKSRDRTMPYQSVMPNQDLIIRRACNTYLSGNQTQPDSKILLAPGALDGSDQGRVGAKRKGGGVTFAAGPSAVDASGQPPSAAQQQQQQQQQNRGGAAGLGSEGISDARRRLGALLDDRFDMCDGDKDDGDDFAGGKTMYRQRFSGHHNISFPMEAAWMGRHSEHVVSGSDDGCLYVWNGSNGRLLHILPSPVPGHVASSIQPHPYDMLLATYGTEPVVRLWSPEAEEDTRLTSSQLATASLNMIESDNQPEEGPPPADPMPGVAGWVELVSRHFGRMAGRASLFGPEPEASPTRRTASGRGQNARPSSQGYQRQHSVEQENTEGGVSGRSLAATAGGAGTDSDSGPAGNANGNGSPGPPDESPARGLPFPCRLM